MEAVRRSSVPFSSKSEGPPREPRIDVSRSLRPEIRGGIRGGSEFTIQLFWDVPTKGFPLGRTPNQRIIDSGGVPDRTPKVTLDVFATITKATFLDHLGRS